MSRYKEYNSDLEEIKKFSQKKTEEIQINRQIINFT